MANIKKVLLDIGVPPHLLGFQYIEEAVKVAQETKNNGFRNIMYEIYEPVAKKFNVTSSSVERCMRHAVEFVFNNVDYEYLEKFFGKGISKNKGKPTNKQFLLTVLMIVENEI